MPPRPSSSRHRSPLPSAAPAPPSPRVTLPQLARACARPGAPRPSPGDTAVLPPPASRALRQQPPPLLSVDKDGLQGGEVAPARERTTWPAAPVEVLASVEGAPPRPHSPPSCSPPALASRSCSPATPSPLCSPPPHPVHPRTGRKTSPPRSTRRTDGPLSGSSCHASTCSSPQIMELLVKHVLKPKHEVLIVEEKAKLLKEYNVVDSQFEIIRILIKEWNKIEGHAQQCKRLVLQYIPLILVNGEKFLEKNDVCALVLACPTNHKKTFSSVLKVALLPSRVRVEALSGAGTWWTTDAGPRPGKKSERLARRRRPKGRGM